MDEPLKDSSESARKRCFVSLKWRALLLTSIVLLLMALSSAWLSYHNLTAQSLEQREQASAARQREWQALTAQAGDRLRQLAALIPSLPGLRNALQQRDQTAAFQALDAQWAALQLDLGLDIVGLYDADGQRLARWEVEPDQQLGPRFEAMLARAAQTETAQTVLDCRPYCVQYLAQPVLSGGRSVGVIVLGVNLADLLRNFAAVSGADVGLLRFGPYGDRQPALGRIESWAAEVSALTNPAASLPVLQAVSEAYPNPGSSGLVQVRLDERTYEVLVAPLPAAPGDAPIRLVVIADISRSVQAIRSATREVLTAGGIGWLGAELLLLGILWRPMSRLRTTANTLPLLAHGRFDLVRRTIARQVRSARWRMSDEIDRLDATTMHLADRLEALESEVDARTRTLARQRDELSRERDFVSSLLEAAQVAILTLDADCCIVKANAFAASLCACTPLDLIGRRFDTLLLAEGGFDIVARMQALASSDQHLRHDSLLAGRDGNLRNVTWQHTRLHSTQPGDPVYLVIGLDNTERRGAENRLAWLADHDVLTGLANRRRLQEELALMLSAAQRQGRIGALLMLDLDQFKYVNEADSHESGDRLLKNVANALVREMANAELVTRLGGDEFALLVRDTSEDAIGAIASQVNAVLSRVYCTISGQSHHVSACVGVVLFPAYGSSVDELLAHADYALYQAKEAGPGHWHLYTDADRARERLQDRVLWKDRVARALAEDRFQLYLQPIMNIRDGSVSHYEVLLRLLDVDGTVHGASAFVDAAERSGLILQIDRLVVHRAIKLLAELHRSGRQIHFSINLSGHSFGDADLLPLLRQEILDSGVDPSCLIFEITETAAVADFAQASATILAIKSLGCHFALDDFGIGFSSFTYLKHFPVDFLKLDGSFVRQLPDTPEDQVIVRAVQQIAVGFGKRTIAEYVENERTLALLRDIGVDYAQGYHVDRPRPVSDFFPMLAGGPAPLS